MNGYSTPVQCPTKQFHDTNLPPPSLPAEKNKEKNIQARAHTLWSHMAQLIL